LGTRDADVAPDLGADAAPMDAGDGSVMADTAMDAAGDVSTGVEFTSFEREPFTPSGCCGAEVNIAIASDGGERILAKENRNGFVFFLARDGDGWSDTNVTEATSLGRPFSDRSALALDSRDRPHVLFTLSVDSAFRLHYATLDDTWRGIPIGDSDVNNLFTHFAIATDASDTPHVVWFDRATLALRHAVFNGTDFDVETVDTPAAGDQSGEYARVAIAGDGTVHISYLAIVSGMPVLRHASGTPGSWTLEDVPGIGAGVHGSMLIDADGNLHIVSTGLVGGRADGLYWSVREGTNWTEVELASPDDFRFSDVDAVLDSQGRPWVAGGRSISGRGFAMLFYPRGSERAQLELRGDVIGDALESVGIALDADDAPFVAVANNLLRPQ
ncbi:MAG: hypothetical protein AAF645_05365, partial [Myxococcota bacterium]